MYERIVYRKLDCERNLELMNKLETFIKTVIGMKYKINPTKIFRKTCTNDAENIKADKTYFCSELVASAYKCLGLLPKDVSASQYWPGNFSAKGELNLLEGAKLNDELLLEF